VEIATLQTYYLLVLIMSNTVGITRVSPMSQTSPAAGWTLFCCEHSATSHLAASIPCRSLPV